MPTIWVRLGRRQDYPIVVRPGVLRTLGALARQRVRGRVACIISHPRIQKLYGHLAERSLAAAGFRVSRFLVPEGETSKSLAQIQRLTGLLLRQRIDRSACIVALGGGVIGDLAGFLAAVYMRGIDFIQVPTTLLAQVDSSVGGKVAVNHPMGKNVIGAFYQPRLVVSDPLILRTLPVRQFRSGLAEVIKIAAIADADLFAMLERRLPQVLARQDPPLTQAIARACELKAQIVEQDEKEHGLRAFLNYGHTLGHALEAYHHYKGYLHGEAVAIGMVAAARLARETGICQHKTTERQERILQAAGLPVAGRGEKWARVWKIMQYDKKARGGKMNFVLTPSMGHARLSNNLMPFSVRKVINTVVAET